MLSLVLGSSTHAFELMLSAFILGLAAGSFWIRSGIDGLAKPGRFLGWMQLAMGVLALATLPAYGQTFHAMRWIMGALERSDSGYAMFNLASHGLALAIMLPATFCAGTTLPLITHALIRSGQGERSIGAAWAANTMGAIVGVAAAVHVGLPVLGLKGLIVAGAAIDLALGLYLLWRDSPSGSRRSSALASAAALAAVGLALFGVELDPYQMASGVYRHGELLDRATTRLLDHRDGKTATVDLTASASGRLAILTNGKVDAAIEMGAGGANGDESTMVLLGALPQLLRPEARSAANIGFGSGLTTHTLLASPRLERVDTIEIEPAMVALARGFRPRNARAYDDPRSHVHLDDAKTFLSSQGGRYDVIVSEPSNPWVSGVAGLFSVEHYRLAARHLAADGLFVQWMQLYEFDDELAASVLKALSAAFADFDVYLVDLTDVIVVASPSPLPPLDERAWGNGALAEELRRIGIDGVQDVEIRRVGDRRMLAPWLAGFAIPANSDYRPVVDQRAARARFLGAPATGLLRLASAPFPTMELLGVTAPGWTRTRVSPTTMLPQVRAACRAVAFRDAVATADPGAPGATWALAGDGAGLAARQLLEACARPPGGDKVAPLLDVARQVVPYLRPIELEALWSSLGRWPCASGLGAEEASWLELFRAVGRRDAEATASLSLQLLDRGAQVTPERGSYLGAAALLGEVARGDLAGARQLWLRYRTGVFAGTQPDVLFAVLGAMSEAR
jgi:spermidine synthase